VDDGACGGVEERPFAAVDHLGACVRHRMVAAGDDLLRRAAAALFSAAARKVLPDGRRTPEVHTRARVLSMRVAVHEEHCLFAALLIFLTLLKFRSGGYLGFCSKQPAMGPDFRAFNAGSQGAFSPESMVRALRKGHVRRRKRSRIAVRAAIAAECWSGCSCS